MIGTPFAIACLVLAAVPCALFLWNLCLYRRAPAPAAGEGGEAAAGARPGVSILIPARNEARNIRAAVESALASTRVDLEVIVLDDHSTDRTGEIVRGLAAADPRLRLLPGPPLPDGWCGKMFACHHLARHATRPLLLFVDADVRLAPDAPSRLADALARSRARLISGVPRQLTETWAEKLLIPLIHFVLLAYLPLWAMRLFRFTGFGAGCGQLFLADAEAYCRAGGHEAIRATRHDGLKLPKAFRRAGYFTDLVDATDLASCRLYHDAREVWHGLFKNATEGLGAPAAIVPLTVLLIGGQVVPFVLLPLALFSPGVDMDRSSTLLLAAAAGCALLPRLLAAVRFHQPFVSALFHPAAVVGLEIIQWAALFHRMAGRTASWKGRTPPRAEGA